MELGFQIPIVSGILDFRSGVNSKPRIPVSKAQIFPDYAIRIALLGAIKKVSNDDFTFFFSAVSSSGSSDDKASP